MIELEAQELDNLLLTALCGLGDGDAIAERGYTNKDDVRAAVRQLKRFRRALQGGAPKRPKTKKRYQMLLASMGNPDFGQYAPLSDPEWVSGDTLPEMQKLAEDYRDKWDLGGGNWVMPTVLEGEIAVGHFSYNMRFWEGRFDSKKPMDDRKEIKFS